MGSLVAVVLLIQVTVKQMAFYLVPVNMIINPVRNDNCK